jgi:DNA-directed RNA polymerase subunit K/omega
METRVPDSEGKYMMINVLARRAKELARGGRPSIPYSEGFDPIEVATEEYEAGKLCINRREDEELPPAT